MASGALLFCENSPSLTSILGNEGVVYYRPNDANKKLPELKLAINSINAQDHAMSLSSLFLENHTWKNRGIYLSSILADLKIT
jgi:hypothetical protein